MQYLAQVGSCAICGRPIWGFWLNPDDPAPSRVTLAETCHEQHGINAFREKSKEMKEKGGGSNG